MDNNYEVALNSAQCIHSTNKFGETIYQNICSGALVTVPWGSLDWFIFVSLVGLVFTIVGAVVVAYVVAVIESW